MQKDWIPGTLELAAKVRYGIGSRGIPLFRFVPYDTSIGPFAVGCSQRDLFHNVHAIVTPNAATASNDEPSPQTSFRSLLPKGTLVQNLGIPNDETNLQVLLAAYAYDGKKSLRLPKLVQTITPDPPEDFSNRPHVEGITFHIDPPGCKDVDDSFSFLRLDGRTSKSWRISINIADVAAWVKEGSELDTKASERATSFYSPEGEALVPMFPREISEGTASLRGAEPRPTLSLQFTWTPGAPEPLTDFQWVEAMATTHTSYTYDEADAAHAEGNIHMTALKELSAELDPTNTEQTSHEWVQNMMILYNRKAGETLRQKRNGILRRHSAPKAAALAQWTAIDPSLSFLAYEAATFCLATEEDTRHFGLLEVDSYAYASSPIRRYCDLVNQRILKGASATVQQETVDALNRRQKQAKAFSRDLFFMRELATGVKVQEGLIVAHTEKAVKAYIPAWKRCVKVKCLQEIQDLPPVGSRITLEWLCDYEKPNWKEKIIFRMK